MKFDINKVKPDFSNVRSKSGLEIDYLIDTKLSIEDHLVIKVKGAVYVVACSPSSLQIVDEPKLIDWSKLPVDTLVEIEKGKRRLHSNREYAATVFGSGADSVTGKGQGTGLYEKAKLIENPNFTYWPGGDCPVPEGVMVESIMRNGDKAPQCVRWNHIESPYDIIAYRILGAADGYSPFFQGREF